MDWLLLAQESVNNVNNNSILGLMIGAAGGTGFAIWYGWYLTTRVIPDKEQKRVEENKAIAESHKESIKCIMGEFEQAHKEHREDMRLFWDEHKSLEKAYRDETGKLTQAIERLCDKLKDGPHTKGKA